MNYCLASKTTHTTFLGFLDKSSIFQLLLRVHYEDLMNLCKARTYVWRITCTPYLQECWKKYNITTVETKTINSFITCETDRLDRSHGTTYVYDNVLKMRNKEYIYVWVASYNGVKLKIIDVLLR
jgi:hypothetical protein